MSREERNEIILSSNLGKGLDLRRPCRVHGGEPFRRGFRTTRHSGIISDYLVDFVGGALRFTLSLSGARPEEFILR